MDRPLVGYQFAPTGHRYADGAWANSSRQFVVPALGGDVDVYGFDPSKGSSGLTFQASTPTPFGYLRSIAANGSSVFVGTGGDGEPCADSGYVPYTGVYANQQQACDTSAPSSYRVSSSWWDGYNYLDGDAFTSALRVFSGCCNDATGYGPFTFQQYVQTPDGPFNFAQTGTTLFLNGDGSVDACVVAPNSVSACSNIVNGNYAYGSRGMQVL